MSELFFHPKTKSKLDGLLLNPPHALLVLGPNGAGKSFTVQHYTSLLLNTDNLADYPYIKKIDAAEGEGIAYVREIRTFLSLKTTGDNEIRRIVVIENIDKLGNEAQNALLKIIEEPPADTAILLTASSTGNIADTILSRVSYLNLLPLDEKTALSQEGGVNTNTAAAAYALSGGYAGLFKAILESDGDHEVKQAVDSAKLFLSQSAYERLCQIDSISKDKNEASKLLDGLELCLHAALKTAKNTNVVGLTKKLEIIDNTKSALSKNVNAKLALTVLAINL